jgi:2,4-dienoyl-CoA reductase-like NADH-dependent reductase (Old Yellow Enzyme family)
MTAATPLPSPFEPGRLGPLRLRNRIVKCGTNEGLARGGLVTDELIEWHRMFAAGGVAMTTLAYCSVSSAGRTFADQVWMRDAALPGLRSFVDAMHAEGVCASIQLGHAGWFASPRVTQEPALGPSRTFSPHAQAFSRAMTAAQLEDVAQEFAAAARLAVEAGFDALEIHAGHGYLLSQFLSPYNNRRRDAYGGSLENRARFPRAVLRAVRDAVGSGVLVYPKLNMLDGFDGGLTLADGVAVARLIEEDGSVDALQLTGGHTTRSPFFLMRGEVPRKEMVRYEKDWVRRFGIRFFGRFFMQPFPFVEAFFLDAARHFRDAVELPIMLLGGITRLDSLYEAREEGFEFIAMGRALIREPDLVHRLERGEAGGSMCDHCNKCVAEMERPSGTRCVHWPENALPEIT